ncbi:MAG: hypothetical protein WCD89_22215 [Anaerocolumna sp.]
MKIWKRIILLACVIALILGLIERQTYTNLLADEKDVNNFSVIPLTDEILSLQLDIYLNELKQKPIIIKVKAKGELNFLYRAIKQNVQVLEVYKGTSLKVGDQIQLLTTRTVFDFNDIAFNMGFTNLLKKDNEYLVFCEDKIDSPFKKDKNLFRVSEFIINPIFCYDNFKNTVTNTSEKVLYSQIASNEFVVEDESTLKKLLELKQKLFYIYPR